MYFSRLCFFVSRVKWGRQLQYLYYTLEYKCMSHIYIYSICTYTVLGFIVPFEYFYCIKKTVVLKLLKINVFLYIKATYLSEISLGSFLYLFYQPTIAAIMLHGKKRNLVAYKNRCLCSALKSSGWLWFG